jgi:hypothetical protein
MFAREGVNMCIYRTIRKGCLHTKSWLYSRLKRARRFSGLLAADLLLPPGAREVPAINRDHYCNS